MPDREKVIKGLECCHVMVHDLGPDKTSCGICPYKDVQTEEQIDLGGIECIAVLHDDAMALLKEQKAEWIEYPECLAYDGAYCDSHIVCSACKHVFSIMDNCTEEFDYCPHCGAKM